MVYIGQSSFHSLQANLIQLFVSKYIYIYIYTLFLYIYIYICIENYLQYNLISIQPKCKKVLITTATKIDFTLQIYFWQF